MAGIPIPAEHARRFQDAMCSHLGLDSSDVVRLDAETNGGGQALVTVELLMDEATVIALFNEASE